MRRGKLEDVAGAGRLRECRKQTPHGGSAGGAGELGTPSRAVGDLRAVPPKDQELAAECYFLRF
eukprot:10005074-Lingulodinium_polyedra.AAC.1